MKEGGCDALLSDGFIDLIRQKMAVCNVARRAAVLSFISEQSFIFISSVIASISGLRPQTVTY